MPWVDMTFPQASVRCVWITLHSVLTRGCSLCWMSWMHLRGDHTWLDAFGSGLSQGISDENAVRNILHLCSKAEAVSAVHVSELRAIAPLKSCCESKSLARWPRLHMIRGNGGGSSDSTRRLNAYQSPHGQTQNAASFPGCHRTMP